jgi:hypothetical protein
VRGDVIGVRRVRQQPVPIFDAAPDDQRIWLRGRVKRSGDPSYFAATVTCRIDAAARTTRAKDWCNAAAVMAVALLKRVGERPKYQAC